MEIIDILNNNTVDREFLSSLAKKYRFKFKYINNDFNRLLFYHDKKPKSVNAMTRYFNGMILENVEFKSWQIVCWPTAAFQELPKTQKSINNVTIGKIEFPEPLENFFIFPVHESSIINVYFSPVKQCWQFGTKKSFNIVEETWRGVNFGELVKNIDLNTLDKQLTYVYAIAHDKLHIFNGTNSCNLLATCGNNAMEYFGEQEVDFYQQYKNLTTAYKNYLKTGEKFFGFIMRSQDNSYLFESDLMRTINRLVYKPPTNGFTGDRNQLREYLKNNNYIEHVIARCYFNDRNTAKLIIPDFINYFTIIDKINNVLAIYVKNRLDNVENNNKTQITINLPESVFEQFYNEHRIALSRTIGQRNQLKLIQKFISEIKNIDIIFSLLKNNINELRQL